MTELDQAGPVQPEIRMDTNQAEERQKLLDFKREAMAAKRALKKAARASKVEDVTRRRRRSSTVSALHDEANHQPALGDGSTDEPPSKRRRTLLEPFVLAVEETKQRVQEEGQRQASARRAQGRPSEDVDDAEAKRLSDSEVASSGSSATTEHSTAASTEPDVKREGSTETETTQLTPKAVQSPFAAPYVLPMPLDPPRVFAPRSPTKASRASTPMMPPLEHDDEQDDSYVPDSTPKKRKGRSRGSTNDGELPTSELTNPGEVTPKPYKDDSTGETIQPCPQCNKKYAGKNARSILRRHMKDKHGVPLASQPRASRWDNHTRPRTDDERRERQLEAKRVWARKNRLAKKQRALEDAEGTDVEDPSPSPVEEANNVFEAPMPPPAVPTAHA